jgi:hypothetical protein
MIYNNRGEEMNTDNTHVKSIPYGVSDYEYIRTENAYYVDKTGYLRNIENAGKYLFFIRPRRFGKSLFLSTIESYYDIKKSGQFDLFYQGTHIHENPTPGKNQYLVLKFNFSAVEPHPQKIESSFLNNIQTMVGSFLYKYRDYLLPHLSKKLQEKLDDINSPADILLKVIHLCKDSNCKIYIIIDEYDNFANTILSSSGSKAYEALTHGEGFFRAFFNVLKEGTTGSGAPISRLFITGVSPVTLDDVTSGFNIGKNISLEPGFNRTLGFTKEDVSEMIEYYRSNGLIQHPTGYLLEIMTQWYGNYRFSRKDEMKLFNSDMVLYFIDNYLSHQELPDDLIDMNVRIDYRKLRHLIILDRDKTKPPTPNGNFNKLKEIIEQGSTSSKIVKGFPVEKLKEAENFKSLLFYLGLLAIKGPEKDKLRLQIPNETVKRLYYDYIEEAYRETGIFDLDLDRYADLMTDMAYDGKWKPLLEFITGRMSKSMSLRDLITGEKSIQAFLNVYLGLSDLYIIHSEKELNKGYADLVLEPFLARYEGMKYSYLMEIKYTKSGLKPGDTEIHRLKSKAEEQLKKYSIDKNFKKNIEKTRLIKLVLIFSGHELIDIDEVK